MDMHTLYGIQRENIALTLMFVHGMTDMFHYKVFVHKRTALTFKTLDAENPI